MSLQTTANVNFSLNLNAEFRVDSFISQNSKSNESFMDFVSFYKNEKSNETDNSVNKVEKEIQKSNEIQSEKKELNSNSVIKKEESDFSNEKIKKIEQNEEITKTDFKTEEVLEESKKIGKNENPKSNKKRNSILDRIIQDSNENQFKVQSEQNFLPKVENIQTKITQNLEINEENKIDFSSETDFELPNENSVLQVQFNEEINDFSKTELKFSDKELSKNEKTKVGFLDNQKKIRVEDLRTEQVVKNVNDEKTKNSKIDVKNFDQKNATITMELNQNVQANANILSQNSQVASSDGSNFMAMLNNQIQNNVPEFVKAGNIVLKDNNQGSINLILHPEEFGDVKIHLSLDGKTLSGQISVSSKEALQVFKDNSETLREAFIKNGFDNANFDVSFNNNFGGNQNMDFTNQNETQNFFAKRSYQSNFFNNEELTENEVQNNYELSNYSINIVA